MPFPPANLKQAAEFVGADWKQSHSYYENAESEMELKWSSLVWPFINACDFTECVDLAAGHGRNTQKLLDQPGCSHVHCIDINDENVAFCRQRFEANERVTCHKTDGYTIGDVPDASITMFYCFDAMVHFDSDVVRSYLAEIKRVLVPGTGRAFLHHSNYIGNPGGDVHKSPAWRNFMSKELLKHYAAKEGLLTLKQQPIDWKHDGTFIDCFSLLRA